MNTTHSPDTYNGFEPSESRSTTMKPLAGDAGHSIVKMTTTRRGSRFSFTYRATCECGKTFGSRQSTNRVFHAHNAHLRALAAKDES